VRQHLALLVPAGQVLVLHTLRYAEEIRPASGLKVPSERLKDAQVSDKEMQMALKLVDSMSGRWDARRFHDTYREDILKRVEEKVKAGQTDVLTEPGRAEQRPKGAKIIDLMELLKRSVEKTGQDARPGGGAAKRRRAPKRAARHRPRPQPAEGRRHA
jgi:DNA end-binding protein Ku